MARDAAYYENLRRQNASAQPTPAPTQQPALVERAENAVLQPIQQAEAATQGMLKPSLTPEQQTSKFGGEIGSQAYYEDLYKNRQLGLFGRGLTEAVGMQLPAPEIWDGLSFKDKAAAAVNAASAAAIGLAVRTPRELVKAPLRFALSTAETISDPFRKNVDGSGSFQNEFKNSWLGTVRTYSQDIEELRKAGYGKYSAALMTANMVVGDATISVSGAEALNEAFRPRLVPKGNVTLEKGPIQSVIEQTETGLKVKRGQVDSPSEYRSVSKTFAKKYGGNPANTFVKVTPADASGTMVEVAIVRTRKGVLSRVVDKFKGGRTKGKFGDEIKLSSDIVRLRKPAGAAASVVPEGAAAGVSVIAKGATAGDAVEAAAPPAPLTPAPLKPLLSKPLKGFENDLVTGEELSHLGEIMKAGDVDFAIGQVVTEAVSGKKVIGDMTHTDYVNASHALAAVSNIMENAASKVGFIAKWLSPPRHWSQAYEKSSGIPLYTEGVAPLQKAKGLVNAFVDNWQQKARDIHGQYAGPGFAKERQLLFQHLEGNEGAILNNPSLTPEVKSDLVRISGEMRTFYNELGPLVGVKPEFFLQNYQSHIKDLGGVFMLNKEGAVFPKKLAAFFKEKREGMLGPGIDDSLAVADIYTKAGANDTFMTPYLEKAAGFMEGLPDNVGVPFKDHVLETLGYADDLEQALNDAFPKIASDLTGGRVQLGPNFGKHAVQGVLDTTYAATMGYSPSTVAKGLLQANHSYALFGPRYYAQAIMKASTKAGLAEARARNLFVELGQPAGRELVKEVTSTGRGANAFRRETQRSLKAQGSADSWARSVTYHQGKMIWDDAFARYQKGDLNYEGLEKAADFDRMDPLDANIVRRELFKGDNDAAFDHYIRTAVDDVQYPYRRGASARVTYGTKKAATQFGTYQIEFTHMLKNWTDRKQWDKLIRWHAATSLTARTLKDAVGVDVSDWQGLKQLVPTAAPLVTLAGNVASWIVASANRDAKKLEENRAEIVRQLQGTLVPGVQGGRVLKFVQAVNRGPNPETGLYTTTTGSGKPNRQVPFKELWLDLWGFPSEDKIEDRERIKNMRGYDFSAGKKTNTANLMLFKAKSERDPAKREQLQKEADDFIQKYNVTGVNLDSFYKTQEQRVFEGLPGPGKAIFAPQVYPQP